jgi:hypothetical protein
VNDATREASFFSLTPSFSLHHTTFIETWGRNFWKLTDYRRVVNSETFVQNGQKKRYTNEFTEDGSSQQDWLFENSKGSYLLHYRHIRSEVLLIELLGFVGNGNRLQQIMCAASEPGNVAQMNSMKLYS